MTISCSQFSLETKSNINYISRSIPGWYQETLIVNSTNTDIYIVDIHNNKYCIPPTSYEYQNQYPNSVVIQYKVNNGYLQKNQFGYDQGGNYYQAILSLNDLEQNYFYSSELNIVVTHKKFLSIVKHPQSILDYQNQIKTTLSNVRSILNNPVFTVIVNDPHKTVDKLYMIVNNKMCSIPVTHYEDQPAFCNIYYLTDSDVSYTDIVELSLDEILHSSRGVIKNNDELYFIGDNETTVRNAYQTHKRKESEKITITEHEKIIKEEIEKTKDYYEQEIQRLKQINNNLKVEYQLQLNKLEHDVFRFQKQTKEYEDQVNYYKRTMEYRKEQDETDLRKEKLKYEKNKEKNNWLVSIGKGLLFIIPIIVSIFWNKKPQK
jgi:hypothetical protein